MIKAIIFDMDGVLIPAKDWHYHALNQALVQSGIPSITLENHQKIYDGLPTRVKLLKLAEHYGISQAKQEEINALKQKYLETYIANECVENAEHVRALRMLKKKYILALASNSLRHSIETMLGKAGLLTYFDVILSNQDVTEPKPSPEIYCKTMDLLNIAADECLILEDSAYGIRAAYASGAHVMVVRDVCDVVLENIEKEVQLIAVRDGRQLEEDCNEVISAK